MRLVCTHFDYGFRLHGREGGLNGTRWIFEPVLDDGDGGAEVRHAMQDAAAFHRDLLDRVFANVLKGARQPALSGGEDGDRDGSAVTSGWQYAGRLTWTGRLRMRRRLERLFGEAAFPAGRGVSSGDSFHANIGLRFSGGERPPGLHLWVSHNLPPPVNASLFRRLLARKASGFAPEPARKAERLDTLLAAAASGPGAGGYEAPAGLWHAGEARRRLTAGN